MRLVLGVCALVAMACASSPGDPSTAASSPDAPAPPPSHESAEPAPEPVEPAPGPVEPAPGRPRSPLPETTAPDIAPGPPALADCASGCYGEPVRTGVFDSSEIPEASGLAASVRNPGVLYLLDDGPGTAAVWAVTRDGAMLGAIAVRGLDARDAEGLSVGWCDADRQETCIYVADIGDNLRQRDSIEVHRLVEPDLADGVPDEPVAAEVAVLTYPDEPSDAEALLVDDDASVYVVAKARFDRETGVGGPTHLYALPGFASGDLRLLGELPIPQPKLPLASVFVGNTVTGGSAHPGRVLLRTYDHVLEFTAPQDDATIASLATWEVRETPTPPLPQSEAITWARDVCGYYTVSEAVGDIWLVPCRITARG